MALTGRRRKASAADARAARLAEQVCGCERHQKAAKAIHRALEDLLKRFLVTLNPDSAISDVLPNLSAPDPSRTARDAAVVGGKQLLAGQSVSKQDLVAAALRKLVAERFMKTLLGPAIAHCTWDPETIGARSVRGIINERVRCLLSQHHDDGHRSSVRRTDRSGARDQGHVLCVWRSSAARLRTRDVSNCPR